jgi:hypothetical protein
VSKTKILVSLSNGGDRQMTVYSNHVTTHEKQNAMILPVPNPNSVKLHDLSKQPDLFDDLSREFYDQRSDLEVVKSLSFRGMKKGMMSDEDTLAVHTCGSYQVSIVPSVQDFHRLNKTVFQINPVVFGILKKYYTTDAKTTDAKTTDSAQNQNNGGVLFGFLVCKLKYGSEAYHPLGYSHDVCSYRRIFVPTRHHHDGTEEETTSKFDHEIYSINTGMLCGNWKWSRDRPAILEKISDFAWPTVWMTMNKLSLTRNTKNTDLWFRLHTDDTPSKLFGPDGCLFTRSHPAIEFDNWGDIYVTPTYYGMSFCRKNGSKLKFCGPGTSFILSPINPAQIKIIDDIGLPQQYESVANHQTRPTHCMQI